MASDPLRMVSTFIAAIMRISARVNAQQVLAVMQNTASFSDLRCPGKSVQDVARHGTVPGWDILERWREAAFGNLPDA